MDSNYQLFGNAYLGFPSGPSRTVRDETVRPVLTVSAPDTTLAWPAWLAEIKRYV